MKFWILIFLVFTTVNKVFGIDKISGSIKQDSCAIRISNQPIRFGDPQTGTQFCSGSIIENGSMIVFAAHCLNQILETKSDILDNSSFEIGLPEKETSEKVHLQAGQYSSFFGDLLSTVSSREDFLQSGNPKYIKDDLAIIRLKRPVSNMANCPVIPSASECDELEKNIISFGKGIGLYVDFFISIEMLRPGSTISKVFSWYPSKSVIQVQATDLEFSPSSPEVKNLHSPLKASFSKPEKEVRMRKGDSGSLAYWNHNFKNIFVGVQSATISGSPNQAYFSQVCKHVGTKKFEAFLKTFKSSEDIQ